MGNCSGPLAGQNLDWLGKFRQEAGRKEMESKGSHVAPPETKDGTLPGKQQPHGDIQITRYELN